MGSVQHCRSGFKFRLPVTSRVLWESQEVSESMFLHLECKNNNGTYLIDNCPQSPAVVCQGWDHVVCRTACLGLRQGPMLTGENFKMVRPSEGLLLLSPLFPSPHLRPALSPCRGCSVSPQPLPPLLPFREPTLSAGSVTSKGLGGLGLRTTG